MLKEEVAQIFQKLSHLLQRFWDFLRKRHRRKTPPSKDEPIPNQKPMPQKPVHPWRMCPGGEHWVHTHLRRVPISEKNPSGITDVEGHCRINPSGKDQLYVSEMYKITEQYFGQFKLSPLPEISKFGLKGQAYDHLIQGWTQYWNDVLKPKELLDSCLVKALIATESSFNSQAWNGKRGSKRARGLTQVTDQTLRYLASERYHELKDHFVHLEEDDMLSPNFSICAGIRWLFRKKEIADSKTIGGVSWIDAVSKYKDYKIDDPKMKEFIDMYEELKKK